MENILNRLQRGEIIIGDGALGTQLMQRGLRHGEPPELFNVEKPQIIEEIARLYLDAGAEIIETNTFGASPLRLEQFSLENRMEELNRAGNGLTERLYLFCDSKLALYLPLSLTIKN